MNIKPIGERVLVLPDGTDELTDSGLIVRKFDRDIQQRGTVAAVGDRVRTVSEGDRIVFERFAGSQVTANDKDYVLMNLADVIAVID